MGTVERDLAPLGVEAVDPVEAAEGVGDADGEDVEVSGVDGAGAVALEGKLFHDGVADELLVEVDLGAEVGAADVEEDALAAELGGDVDGAMEPGDAEVGAVLRDVVVGGRLGRVGRGVTVFLGCVGARLAVFACAVLAPEVLLDGGGECDLEAGGWRERSPAAGGRVDGQRLVFAAELAVNPRNVFRKEDVVVLPFGFVVDPETPVFVGNERSVFGVPQLCGLCVGLLGESGSDRSGGGDEGRALQEGAAGDAVRHVLVSLAEHESKKQLPFGDDNQKGKCAIRRA